MNSNNLSRNNQDLAKNIVLIDGFSGSGKALVSPIISYLERGEKCQFNELFETAAMLTYLGGMTNKDASVLVNIEADKTIYNLMIGRNVNFRKTDASSPYFDGVGDMYLSRLKVKEGNSIVDSIINDSPILSLHIHYIFGYSDFLFDAFGDKLKAYIILLRNPFYLIERWFDNGWPNKLCKDNRELQFCIKHNDVEIPWYASEYADEYVTSNDIGKCILTVFNLYIRMFKMYNTLSCKNTRKVQFIVFEDFAVDPDPHIDKICIMLNTRKKSDFFKIKENLSLPRELKDVCSLSCVEFIEKYKNYISSEDMTKLSTLDKEYKNFIENFI
jgi:hypothetical protein